MPLNKRILRDDTPQTLNAAAAAEFIAGLAMGLISERVAKGRDTNDRAFAPYSAAWTDLKGRMGRDVSPPDLTLSGGLLASLHVAGVDARRGGATATITPGTGTSPTVRAPPKDAKGKPRARHSSGRRGPPHVLVGAWLHHGTEHMPARPWLGLSPSDRDALARDIRAGGAEHPALLRLLFGR
jgi:hypothetical protein